MMNTWTLRYGWTLVVENHPIDVTSNLPRPDPAWRYTDTSGHEHAIDTLAWIEDETYWCEDCRDEHTEGHWECPFCHEHITPGTKGPSMVREFIPGPTEAYLTGPSGEYIPLAIPFTQADIDHALGFDGGRGGDDG